MARIDGALSDWGRTSFEEFMAVLITRGLHSHGHQSSEAALLYQAVRDELKQMLGPNVAAIIMYRVGERMGQLLQSSYLQGRGRPEGLLVELVSLMGLGKLRFREEEHHFLYKNSVDLSLEVAGEGGGVTCYLVRGLISALACPEGSRMVREVRCSLKGYRTCTFSLR